jgi:outer membrane murein-binding lipoprotein Lpp
MKTIKKMMIGAVALATAVFMVGCDKDLPSPEKINAVATTIGRTAGYACELAKTKTAVKDGIIQVLDVISTVVPREGEIFAQAWTPVITEELQKLVAAGKLDEAGAKVAKMALSVACDGIDYVFIKYPKAKDVKELVSATTTGFVTGFKSVVTVAAGAEKPAIDEEAYKYIKSRMAR